MTQVTSMNEGQIKAVEARNCNILVSAPAGSGKTKILVTRILELLKEGVHVDSFLVLTFTQAAAGEMKQRLMGMLDGEIEKADGKLKEHLLAQKAKLPFAFITNFHGFCNQLIDRYGYLVGVKTGYEILSDNERLLHQALDKTMDDLLGQEDFVLFRSIYFHQREALEEQLLKLYEVLQALGNRDAFIKKMDEEIYGFLENQKDQDLSEWCFYPELQDELRAVVIRTLASLEDLKLYCMQNGMQPFFERPLSQGPSAAKKEVPYVALKNYYLELLRRLEPGMPLMGAGGLNEWAIQKPESTYNMPWKDLGDEVALNKNVLSSKKSALTAQFKKVYEQLIDTDMESTRLIHQEAKRVIEMMLSCTFKLEENYRASKRKENVLDFNDLERYATMLLQKDLPVATALNEKLYEIMVDEYQDTNMVQENIVRLIADATSKQVPCFMVGDMKQSIYRFRQADPQIFKEKYDRFPLEEGSLRVDLAFNYRSSKVVLDSINFIFNQMMDVHIGSLEYYEDKSAQLNYDFLRKEGAKDTSEYEMVKQKALARMKMAKDDKTEVLMVDSDSPKPKDFQDSEYEAYMVGKRILELKANGLDGMPLTYSDMAVLMRQTTHFMIYKKVFDKLGIPTTIVLSKGFMTSVEMRQMLMVYQAFNHPYDDMAMYSLLRAPFNFSYFKDQEIALVKEKGISLYESIQSNDLFSHFLEVFEELRKALSEMPFASWNSLFFEKSGYLNRVSMMKNGIQRYQNLCLLQLKVKEKQDDIHWIKDWVQYFDELGSSADAPAIMPKDQQAVVFMTIHKSKGLEFPVVFVSMHDKKFNLQDGKQRLIFDRNLSLSIKPRIKKDLPLTLFDQEANFQNVVVEYDNPFLTLLGRLQNKESISEEMRIYYVALTRAGKKLILTGTMSHDVCEGYLHRVLAQEKCQMPESSEHQNWILNRNIRYGLCYLDWLIPSVMRHQDVLCQMRAYYPELVDELSCALSQKYEDTMENTSQSRFDFRWYSHEDILNIPLQNEVVENLNLDKEVFDINRYAYIDQTTIPQSIAVTALGKENDTFKGQAASSTNQGMSAASKGTLVHEFMEFIPMNKNEDVTSRIEALYQAKKYNDEEYSVLIDYVSKIEAFRKSECFCWMQEAKTCLKEQPFCLEKDGQVVHGTIDVLCINESNVVIIDYKTDRVSKYAKEEDLISRHSTQLQLYKEALQKIYPQKMVEAYLYYLETSRCVQV